MCPVVFQGHPSNFKVTWLKKLSFFTQIGRFRTVTQIWIHWWLLNYAPSLKQHRRGALLFFKVIRQISSSHRTKNRRFWRKLSVSRLQLKFEFTDGFEMVHKAWCSIEKVPYCFWGSSIKFQDQMGKKNHKFSPELNHFWTVTWHSIEEVPYCFLRSSIKFQGHGGWKIDDLNPIWIRLLGRSQLSNPTDLPC